MLLRVDYERTSDHFFQLLATENKFFFYEHRAKVGLALQPSRGSGTRAKNQTQVLRRLPTHFGYSIRRCDVRRKPSEILGPVTYEFVYHPRPWDDDILSFLTKLPESWC